MGRSHAKLGILVLARSQRNTDILLLFTQLITVYFQLPLRLKRIVFIKHHTGKTSMNVWCPAFIALKNDSSIYFDSENGFSLGPGKHKNAKNCFYRRVSKLSCIFVAENTAAEDLANRVSYSSYTKSVIKSSKFTTEVLYTCTVNIEVSI